MVFYKINLAKTSWDEVHSYAFSYKHNEILEVQKCVGAIPCSWWRTHEGWRVESVLGAFGINYVTCWNAMESILDLL